jgi:NAD(P)-dependent dehydrogenase (short-subunit alcohol dehydrogenase family)
VTGPAPLAVVTGAGRGIGRAVALRLARGGHDMVLAARSTDDLHAVADEVRRLGRRAEVVPTDVTDPESVAALGHVVDRRGGADVLVANSGVAGPTAPLWEVSPAQWADTFDVNVTGVYLSCRAVLPGMVARGRGSVVVIGSMTGKQPLPGRSPYVASKAALVGLVRSLAWDAGRHGIRVNLVSPGPVAGPRLDGVVAAEAERSGLPVEQVRRAWEGRSPLGRFVTEDDVASAVAYLVDDTVSGAVTGADLNVTAGAVMH